MLRTPARPATSVPLGGTVTDAPEAGVMDGDPVVAASAAETVAGHVQSFAEDREGSVAMMVRPGANAAMVRALWEAATIAGPAPLGEAITADRARSSAADPGASAVRDLPGEDRAVVESVVNLEAAHAAMKADALNATAVRDRRRHLPAGRQS